MDDQLATIARLVLRLDTLMPRGRDALDFCPLGVIVITDEQSHERVAGCGTWSNGANLQ